MGSSTQIDYAGLTLVVSGIRISDVPGNEGSLLSGTEIQYLDGITPGTAAASKALILNSSSGITSGLTSLTVGTITPTTIAGAANFTGVPTMGSGGFTAGSTTLNETDLAKIDGITNGTVAASKAIVVDATKKLSWTVSDTQGSMTLALTATGTSTVDGAIFSTTTEASLGNWANAVNAKLDFGSAGKVTGLGGAMCAELDLGPGTTSSSYAVFEGELIAPASASTGTRTSFSSLNAGGANVAAVDTSAFLFDLNGLTAGSGKLFNTVAQAVTAAARLRVQVGGTTYYIPLCASEALTS